jgi:hypothetical protein
LAAGPFAAGVVVFVAGTTGASAAGGGSQAPIRLITTLATESAETTALPPTPSQITRCAA